MEKCKWAAGSEVKLDSIEATNHLMTTTQHGILGYDNPYGTAFKTKAKVQNL